MKRWVPENPTTTTMRLGGVFHSTASGTTFTAGNNPSASLAPAADVAAPRVSLAQLTYSVESGPTTSGQDKASSCETTSDRGHSASKRRTWKSEGQLRAARPHAAPSGQTADPAALPDPEQRRLLRGHRARTSPQQVPALGSVGESRTAETTQWTGLSSSAYPFIPVPSGLWFSCGHSPLMHTCGSTSTADSSATTSTSSSSTASSSGSSDGASLLPPPVLRTTSKGIAAPKPKPCADECTRRDVGTATDAVPRMYENWGDWMGGRLPVMVGAALLSALLVASAVATTVAIMNRHSTTATGAADPRNLPNGIAGLPPTEALAPGMSIPGSPLQDVLGATADEEAAEDAWKRPFNASKPSDGDSAADQPAIAHGNESGGFGTSENPTRPECGVVFYTYCQQPRHEFVYRASINACLATSDDHPAQLCNRGTNRFASWSECETSCVLTQPPREACLGKTLLLGCRSKDIRTSWWWFDGRACQAWKFPRGGCPANGSAVFPTARQCTAHCTNPRYPACTTPRSAPCGSAQLKFPFFAAVAPLSAAHGGTRCYRLTRRVLESHRCLTGANRFLTKTACELTCKKPNARP
ncbi:hypothetical protein MTO96_016269 [Rhipicephalus appendiculatus]